MVGATSADVRDTMVEGVSGILSVSPPSSMPVYEPSKRRLTWPNGAVATTFSGDEPARLRGPQFDGAWVDELAHFNFPQEAWDMLQFGLRLGQDPRCVVTTTPRPIPLVKALVASETTRETRGSTYENRDNLAPTFFERVVGQYEGTRLGRQELEGEILDDNPGALWTRGRIEELRVNRHPDLVRVVVGVDPSGSDEESAAEAGIVVCGIGTDGRGYVLEDRSLRGTPNAWASAAVTAYHVHRADRIVAEVNFGGRMVESTVRTVDPMVSFEAVNASRGKQARAEPVAALYEQGKVSHVGTFPALEDQMAEWVPGGKSPDRLDALVWALTCLMLPEEYNPLAGMVAMAKTSGWGPRRRS